MRKLFITILVILSTIISIAQVDNITKPIDVLPPSPNSASLGQYGGINFGLSSGTISYSIPILEINSTNIKLPISIGYNSNGLRVDAIASRVGLGWNLNAGGVVTRTVFGVPDEYAQRLNPHANYPQQTRELVNFMEALSSSFENGAFDGEPDIFSFNFAGYDGRFILDSNKTPVLLSPSAIKVSVYFISDLWNIKIITPDGIQYLFGGVNATEKSKSYSGGVNCGKNYMNFVPTAWYLKTIIHPNNDQITFSYSNVAFNHTAGINESQFYKLSNANSCGGGNFGACQVLPNTSCISWYLTTTPVLNEISASNGVKVKFSYVDRSDVGDKLLKKIEHFQPNASTPIRTYDFNYEEVIAANNKNTYSNSDASLLYRPFLMELVERSTDGTLSKKHRFVYNDKENLPARLSYAQDHYGFYNGADNSSLLPTPSTETLKSYFPFARANRETDGVFASKGILKKIIYPTGGYDEIFYESNTVKAKKRIEPPRQEVYTHANTGNNYPGFNTTTYSPVASVSYTQQTHLYASCFFMGTPEQEDPRHNQAIISLIDTQTGLAVYSKLLKPGETWDEIVDLLAGYSYQIIIVASGVEIDASASMYYRPGQLFYEDINKPIGGVRVAKVITSNESDGKVSIKKYNYHSFDSPEFSSGGLITEPLYENYIHNKVSCDGPSNDWGSDVITCGFNICDYISIYSNTINTLFLYGGSPVYYRSVIESFGDNYENGGVEHHFMVFPDMAGINRVGNNVHGAPLTSYGYKNGLETYQHMFKMNSGTIVSVKKVITTYKEDSRVDQAFTAYIASKKYNVFCQNTTPSEDEINAYNLIEYSILQKWIYADTVRTLTYNTNGQQYIEEKIVYEYGNPLHALPTKVTTFTSDNKQHVTKNFYPLDLTLTGSEEAARTTLISKNIVSPVLKHVIEKENAPLTTIQTNYNVFPSGLVLPYTQLVSIKSSPLENRLWFPAYNNNGRLLEQKKSNDITISYLWGYNQLYPVAQVLNAPSDRIAYTSFESEDYGGWSLNPGGAVQNSDLITGKKTYSGGVNLTVPTGNYVVTLWGAGNVTVNGQAGTLRGESTRDGSWRFLEWTLTNVSSIQVWADNMDEVRFYPVDAQMTTYTFEPLVGMTSQTDANNRTTYYEYDSFGRLKLVRDQDFNIVKKFCYNYQGQAETCN